MHELPKISYEYDALEPFIDAKTMEIHHTKHHQAYVNNLNAALGAHAELQKKSAEDLIKNLSAVPEDIRTAVRNNGGGHVNHTFFWQLLEKDVEPSGPVAGEIDSVFDGFDKFKESFSKAAMTRFGSGWAWLVVSNGKLKVCSTANQDSPIMGEAVAGVSGTPILGIDVWEHAYYLKYQNRRNEYVEAFFNVINWEKVNENYKKARK